MTKCKRFLEPNYWENDFQRGMLETVTLIVKRESSILSGEGGW